MLNASATNNPTSSDSLIFVAMDTAASPAPELVNLCRP